MRVTGSGGHTTLVAALSELAAHVQRGRSQETVLRIAGDGLALLGMRFVAFAIEDGDLVLRHLGTSRARLEALETRIGRSVRGLRAPMEACPPAAQIVAARRKMYREDLDLFDRFCRAATGYDPAELDGSPGTAGVSNGVIAPVFVREQAWGLISVVSPTFSPDDVDAIALFASHVGSALEVALFVEELSRANADLRRAQRDLVERERLAALGELGAIIAHEVRNPLGVIFNAVSSLRRSIRGASTEEADLLLSIVEEEAERLDGIVSDLLELARPTKLRLAPVNVSQLVDAVVTNVTSSGEAKDVSFAIDVPRELPSIELDARLIRQALFNLVMNAVQACSGRGRVEVRAHLEHHTLVLEVADTGPGVSPEHRARIFEPFFTTKPAGTGLGLALVKRVVETCGGSISLRSSSSGTTFVLFLPVEAHSQTIAVSEATAAPDRIAV